MTHPAGIGGLMSYFFVAVLKTVSSARRRSYMSVQEVSDHALR